MTRPAIAPIQPTLSTDTTQRSAWQKGTGRRRVLAVGIAAALAVTVAAAAAVSHYVTTARPCYLPPSR